VQCLNNLKTIAQAIIMYAEANDNSLPANANFKTNQDNDWVWWQSTGTPFRISQLSTKGIGKYIDGLGDYSPKGLSTLRCPSDARLANAGFLDFAPDQTSPAMAYPSGYPFSYVMNGLMCSGAQPDTTGISPTPVAVRTMTAIKDAANKILLYEEDRRTIDDGYGLLIPNGSKTNILSIRHDGFDEGTGMSNPQDPINVTASAGAPPTLNILAHGERVGNVAFCDGHAAAIDRASAHSKDHWAPDATLYPTFP